MIADLVHSLAIGALHGLVYVALVVFGGFWLVEPEISEVLEVLP